LSFGLSCNYDVECATKYCKNNTCRNKNGSLGSTCLDGTDCLSGFCTSTTGYGLCNNINCQSNADCISGYQCNSSKRCEEIKVGCWGNCEWLGCGGGDTGYCNAAGTQCVCHG
jgi:hypothetical protein